MAFWEFLVFRNNRAQNPILIITCSIKTAQKPYMIGSLGPKALKYESFDAKGYGPYIVNFQVPMDRVEGETLQMAR